MSNLVQKLLLSAVIITSAIIPSGCSGSKKGHIIDTYSRKGMYYEVREFYNSEGKRCTIERGIPEQNSLGQAISKFQIWQKVKKRSGGTINLLKIQKQLNKKYPIIETKTLPLPYKTP